MKLGIVQLVIVVTCEYLLFEIFACESSSSCKAWNGPAGHGACCLHPMLHRVGMGVGVMGPDSPRFRKKTMSLSHWILLNKTELGSKKIQ